jgi:hypothetical protein
MTDKTLARIINVFLILCLASALIVAVVLIVSIAKTRISIMMLLLTIGIGIIQAKNGKASQLPRVPSYAVTYWERDAEAKSEGFRIGSVVISAALTIGFFICEFFLFGREWFFVSELAFAAIQFVFCILILTTRVRFKGKKYI